MNYKDKEDFLDSISFWKNANTDEDFRIISHDDKKVVVTNINYDDDIPIERNNFLNNFEPLL